MHIHGNSMAVNAANFYSAAQGEKAAAAQRAAEIRKRLIKSGAVLEGESTPEEAFMIGQWTDSRHSQVQSGDEYHASASGRDPEFG